MKRIFAALLAASFLVAPFASQAEARDRHADRHIDRHVDRHVEKRVEYRNGKRIVTKHVEERVIVKRPRWARGHKLSRAERRHVVHARDYRRYRLNRPARGQEWVRVNNDMLLVSIATGMILGIASAN